MSKRPEEDPRNYPYQRSFVLLGRESQVAITSSLIRSLGFEPKLNPSLEGLSGIAHAVPLIGVDPHKRRLLVVQTGAEEIPRFYHEPHHQISSNIVSSKSPEEARLEWLRKSLFTTFDVKAAIESRGWSCNTLFFFNSLEVPTASMADKERNNWWRINQMPKDAVATSLGAGQPIGELDMASIRAHVIATGAAFIDAGQLNPRDIGVLASPSEEALPETVERVLAKTRLRQFFSPPLDELLLGTLRKANGLPFAELEAAAAISLHRGHELSPNTLTTDARARDVLQTLKALERQKFVAFRQKEVFIEPDGTTVTKEWEKTAEESLFVKILREIRIPDIIEILIRSIRGAGG